MRADLIAELLRLSEEKRSPFFVNLSFIFACRSSEVIVYFSSSKVHLPRSFAVLIQFLLIWLLLSVRFSVSSSTCLRNSLMSSSHLFLGLPIDLLVLYFELSSGFHSAAFINHLSLGDKAILIASLHFIFLSHIPAFSHFSIFSIASLVLLVR